MESMMKRFSKGDDFAADTVGICMNCSAVNEMAIYGIHDMGTPGEDGKSCHQQKIEIHDDGELRDRVLELLNDGVTYYQVLDTMSHWAQRFSIPAGSVAGLVAILFNKSFSEVLAYYEFLLRDNAKHSAPIACSANDGSVLEDKPLTDTERKLHILKEEDYFPHQ